MDTLWNLEQKLKISTQGAIIILVCTSILVLLSCAATIVVILKNKSSQRNKITSLDSCDEEIETSSSSSSLIMNEIGCCCQWRRSVKKALMESGCWCGARKWDEMNNVVTMRKSKCWRERRILGDWLGLRGGVGPKLPVWQRPILMGEKCELPRFSGVILYDERGRPLPHHQEESEVIGRTTTLKDLL